MFGCLRIKNEINSIFMKPTFSWSVIQKKVGFFWMERKAQYIFLENNFPI